MKKPHMPVSRISALTIAILSFSLSSAAAQAWLQPAGSYYFKFSSSYLSTEEEFNFKGDRQPIFAEDLSRMDTSFRDISFTAYLEYGLSPNLTIVGSVPFKILTAKETRSPSPAFPLLRNERTNGGLGDVFAGARVPVLRRPFALSVQAGVKIPLGYEKEPDNEGPPLGSGEVDAEVQLLYGQSLYPIPAYLSAGVGYRVRGGELHDEILYSAEGGYTFGALSLKLRFDGLQSTEDPPDIGGATLTTPLPGGGGAVNNVIVGDQDVFKLTPGVTYAFDENFSVSGELFHTLAGKDTVAGTAVSIGLVFSR